MKNSKNAEGTQGVATAPSKDQVNISSIKTKIGKNKTEDTKTTVIASKSLYKGTDGMKGEDQKKFRSKIRRKLHGFVNSILGIDRSAEEKSTSTKEFLKFYKENWKVQNFKIEDFSQSKDEQDLKDYKMLLTRVQSSLKK